MKIILHTLVAFSIFSSIITVAFAAEGGGIILLEPSVVNAGENSRVQFGQYMSTLFTTFITVAAVLAVLMIVIGGIQYITSFSGSGKEQGRVRITNAIFGLLLAVSAFLILQTVNPDLVSSDTLSLDIGKFSPITQSIANGLYSKDGTRDEAHETKETDKSEEAAEWGRCTQNGYKKCVWMENCVSIGPDNQPLPYVEIPKNNCDKPASADQIASSICCGMIDTENKKYYFINTDESCISSAYNSLNECNSAKPSNTACRDTEMTRRANETLNYPQCSNPSGGSEGGDTSTIGQWQYQTGIERQAGDMSSSVTSLLSCMREKIPDTSVGQISSISDSRHIGNLASCNQANCSGCSHSCRSCHYGGGTTGNKSMAVDFGDEWNKTKIISAARACDPEAYILDEGNHIHVSTSACPRN